MNTLITDATADLQIQIQTTLCVLFAMNQPGSYDHGTLWRKLDGSGRRTARTYSYRHFYPLQLCSSATGCSCRSTVKQSKAKPSLTRASDLAVGPLVYREHIYARKKPVHRQAAPPPHAPRPEARTCSCRKTWRDVREGYETFALKSHHMWDRSVGMQRNSNIFKEGQNICCVKSYTTSSDWSETVSGACR